MQGTVILSTGSWYEVKLQSGEILKCRIKGIFRLSEKKLTNPIAVGDFVEVTSDARENWVISEIKQRTNYIIRTDTHKKEFKNIIAANIDQCIIIASITQPRTSFGFIDRVLLIAQVYGISAIVVFNKKDLISKKKDFELLEELLFSYSEAGYKNFTTSVVKNENINVLKDILKDKTTLLTGHSGAGKSSLVNCIEPGLNLKVNTISAYSGKGQHTTTFARMYALSFGGNIVDTPGIKEFGIMDIEAFELGHYFPEIRAVMHKCKYSNCLHINEDGCEIKRLLESGKFSPTRYSSYLSIYEEIKSKKKW